MADTLGPGAMAGIGIGAFLAIISILSITWCIMWYQHRRQQQQRQRLSGEPVVGWYGKGNGIPMGVVTRQELSLAENGGGVPDLGGRTGRA